MKYFDDLTTFTYISPQGLQNLQNYRYKGVDLSLVTRYVLTPFYECLLKYVPLWVAPNLITVTGLLCTVFTYVVLAFYAPDLRGYAPSWAYVACALGLFFYQTLDNLDGKQARRTRSSSPLGHLFDHGCDALSCSITGLTVAATTQMGPTWHSVLLLFCIFVPFFVSTWEEYHTGVLFLGVVSGPIEGLLITVSIYLVTAIVGPEMWTMSLADAYGVRSLGSVRANEAFLICMLIAVFFTVAFSTKTVVSTVRSRPGGLRVAIAQLLPLGALLGLASWWLLVSPSDLLSSRPRTFLLLLGFLFANQVARLILAHLCQEPFNPGNGMLLPMVLAICNAHTAPWFQYRGCLINEEALLLTYLAAAFLSWAHLAYSVIQDFKRQLGIACFSIPPVEVPLPV